MADEHQEGLPFAHSVTDVARDIYLFYMDSTDETLGKGLLGAEANEMHAFYEDRAIDELVSFLHESGYVNSGHVEEGKPFEQGMPFVGILAWSETHSLPDRGVARAVALSDKRITSLGLSDAETRFVIDRSVQGRIDYLLRLESDSEAFLRLLGPNVGGILSSLLVK